VTHPVGAAPALAEQEDVAQLIISLSTLYFQFIVSEGLLLLPQILF
jgi:hypothetical protein